MCPYYKKIGWKENILRIPTTFILEAQLVSGLKCYFMQLFFVAATRVYYIIFNSQR